MIRVSFPHFYWRGGGGRLLQHLNARHEHLNFTKFCWGRVILILNCFLGNVSSHRFAVRWIQHVSSEHDGAHAWRPKWPARAERSSSWTFLPLTGTVTKTYSVANRKTLTSDCTRSLTQTRTVRNVERRTKRPPKGFLFVVTSLRAYQVQRQHSLVSDRDRTPGRV